MEQEHTAAFYEANDPSRKATEFANLLFLLPTDDIAELPCFDTDAERLAALAKHCRLENPRPKVFSRFPMTLQMLVIEYTSPCKE
jgi:hypothetical protein